MKRFLHSRRFLVIVAMLVIATPAAWLMARSRAPVDDSVTARVKRGDLVVTVTNTGELKDQALQAYAQALRGYWVAYFQLRRTTLHDFEASRPIREF